MQHSRSIQKGQLQWKLRKGQNQAIASSELLVLPVGKLSPQAEMTGPSVSGASGLSWDLESLFYASALPLQSSTLKVRFLCAGVVTQLAMMVA